MNFSYTINIEAFIEIKGRLITFLQVLATCFFFLSTYVKANGQDNTFAPTLNNNLSFVFLENVNWSYAANLSYDLNLNKDFNWNESSFSGIAIYSRKPFLDFTGGMFSIK